MSLLQHCADGNLSEIKSILENKKLRRSKLHNSDNHNWTCLHHAVKSGNVECIKFLLTFKELDTLAETFEGETALHIACTMPNISFEIVSLLIEANPDLINFVNNEEVDLLQCAIRVDRLDIVKILINNGTPINKQDLDGDTALHIAAITLKLEIIRYLLLEAHIDATICNEKGFTACIILFTKLLMQLRTVSQEQLDYFEELVQFTFDLSNPRMIDDAINQMILLGYRFHEPRSCLYTTMSRLFYAPPSKQYFLEKILNLNLHSCHCLVSALLDINADNSESMTEIRRHLFAELYMLCFTDESFFDEYISETMSNGRNYFLQDHQARNMCEVVRQRSKILEPRNLFHFLKTLILYDIDITPLMNHIRLSLPISLIEIIFVPLEQAVAPRFILGYVHERFNRYVDIQTDEVRRKYPNGCYEALSLKNMCRIALRTYYFKKYFHYSALKALSSLKVPTKICNFLCYNVNNFEI